MNYELKIKKTSAGYTILFTMLVITVLSTLAVGIANISIKQRFLSRLASDSQTSMYLADAGMECALYHYYLGTLSGAFDCLLPANPASGSPAALVTLIESSPGANIFIFGSSGGVAVPASNPCFQIETVGIGGTGGGGPPVVPEIISRGYNTCLTTDPKRVERALAVTFQ